MMNKYAKVLLLMGKLQFFLLFLCLTQIARADDPVNLTITKAVVTTEKLIVKAKLSEETGQHRFKLYDITDQKVLLQRSKRTKDKEIEFELDLDSISIPCRIMVKVTNPELSVKADVENCQATSNPVTTLPPNGEYTLLAANDLGMHCSDLDHSILSILPPFNVVHAQLILKGNQDTKPAIINNTQAQAYYSSASSPVDPANTPGLSDSINTTSAGKSNFWTDSGPQHPNPISFIDTNNTWGGLVYGPLYPSVLAGMLLDPPVDLSAECDPIQGCPSLLNVIEPLPVDVGIPVPDLAELNLGTLKVTQQQMPGIGNIPQLFNHFNSQVSFFTGFDFGAELKDLNWYAADGIPILPVDDFGTPNTYPLLTVSANDMNGNQLASLDVVTPVASEADCHNCHVDPLDCQEVVSLTGDATLIDASNCIAAGIAQTQFEIAQLPEYSVIPNALRVLEDLRNTAKINILRLHDAKHGNIYTAANGDARPCTDPDNDSEQHCLDTRRGIQCSQCHYSPALDLTQQGPQDEPEQGPNGRQQTRHITMSSAMHGHHGRLPDFDSGSGLVPLFPEMPDPLVIDTDSQNYVPRNPVLADQILEQTCYQCHPGKNTLCLRGAMFSGGVVCQDCHGDMEEVGNDFSIRVASNNPGDFILDGSLRVPWASEPACQSCHTGDALNKNHPESNAVVADDGIRLLKAFESKILPVPGVTYPVKVASIYKSPQSRFAENQALNKNGDTVDVLYRLSKGHGGVMCEGCHNSTHAIWPNAMINANDNVASDQLQGHHGTLTECVVCHGENSFDIDDFKDNLDSNQQMKGPHGMHPVNNAMWNEKHKEVDKDNNRNSCRSCHGLNGEGTVLSRVADDRILECKEDDWRNCQGKTLQLSKGDQVGCSDCHENGINKF